MSKQAIHDLAIATQQGKMTFPQVVQGLLEVGVESYLVDFAAKQKTHYLADGTTHTVTALDLAIWLPDVCQLEQTAIASLPVGDRAFGIAVAAPEEVAGIGLGARRNIVEGLDHVGRERNIDRSSRFRLVEEKTVTLEAVAFESDGVANAQPAPAHQQSHGAETSPQVLDGDKSAAGIPIDISRVEYPLEFVSGEVIGGDLNDLDLAQTHAGILRDIAAADAGPEESDQAALFLLLGQLSVLPCVAEI